MKAVGYRETGPIERADALQDVDLPDPTPGRQDLLVEVSAVGVNPIDTKIRVRRAPAQGQVGVLGWDSVGRVLACGGEVTGFAPGDRVFYAGAINRPGCNSERHVVDHRIAAHAPQSLDDAAAVALPLTSITAWELLFDRLCVAPGGGKGQALLVLGAAGGVGSMLVQLASRLTDLTVVATAGRPQSRAWASELGARHVIDPYRPWGDQLRQCGLQSVDLVACLTHTSDHWASVVDVVAPQGRIGVIDDPSPPLDTNAMKPKSLSLHWESMFTRSLLGTPDIARQGAILARVAELVDGGVLRSTLAHEMFPICAVTLGEAHRIIESGTAVGKIVVSGWGSR